MHSQVYQNLASRSGRLQPLPDLYNHKMKTKEETEKIKQEHEKVNAVLVGLFIGIIFGVRIAVNYIL